MKLGFVGLGKMGRAMVARLLEHGHTVVAFDQDSAALKDLKKAGASVAGTLADLIEQLPSPRCIWIMVPHVAVDTVIAEFLPLLAKGDTMIDGGNSFYKDSIQRHEMCAGKGIAYLDVGVSGGPGGARDGACLMIGGDRNIFEQHEILLKDLALSDGYKYVGLSGAGHFVKMIHNGIEYGMMQAIGEGFAIMRASNFNLHLEEIANLYNRGSVIESRLVEWLAGAYKKFGDNLAGDVCCNGSVAHSGEGEWSVATAKEFSIDAPVIKAAFDFRVVSEMKPSYTGQVVSSLRYMFGGHDVRPE